MNPYRLPESHYVPNDTRKNHTYSGRPCGFHPWLLGPHVECREEFCHLDTDVKVGKNRHSDFRLKAVRQSADVATVRDEDIHSALRDQPLTHFYELMVRLF